MMAGSTCRKTENMKTSELLELVEVKNQVLMRFKACILLFSSLDLEPTYHRRCSVLCRSLGQPGCLVVFGTTVTAVAVDVRLAGALLAVALSLMRHPSSLGSVFPHQRTDPLCRTSTRHLTWEIWGR